ncbi:Ca2+ regulator and membrane fusion protein Fig1-domain-containing protein [Parachaetomium inaequale]|uniref:Ca2+ regulator and membrane fusion protein Fig1-domain-containing protein n=1 Tax=Parachaetomium inaequale TaxID=2588326 RepID=A0AAN6PHP4_9PEZI|nr:Ca2+ regulator and membrane fusion protein Fig1-domain-containing protein [Parachaetomium inaequale]
MVLKHLAKMYFKPAGLLRYAPYLLILPIIVFHALSLTGCVSTSPAIPNIYVVSLRANNNATDTPLQVRIGYFGICGIDEDGTRCQAATGRSVETLAANLFPDLQQGTNNTSSNTTTTPATNSEITDLITTALDLQSRTFISVLAGAAVLFVLGAAALFLFKRDVRSANSWEHPRRSTVIRRVTYGLLFGSTALVFAAALATSQSAGALEYASEGMSHASVLIHAGTTLQVLQWIAFGFEVLFALAVPFLVRYKAVAGEEEGKVEA